MFRLYILLKKCDKAPLYTVTMSKRNIVDETFGDISRFVAQSGNRGIIENLDVPFDKVSCCEPILPLEERGKNKIK